MLKTLKTIEEAMADLSSVKKSELIRHIVNQSMSFGRQIYALPPEGQVIEGKHQSYDELKKNVEKRFHHKILNLGNELDQREDEDGELLDELKQYLPMLKYLKENNITEYLENQKNKSNK